MTASEPSLFWIEPAALEALLAEVDAPAAEGPVEPARRPVAGASDPGPGGAPAAPLSLQRGPFEARLAALLGWLESAVAYAHAFVVDADGLPLIEEVTSRSRPSGATAAELLAAAAAMGRTWHSLTRIGGLIAWSQVPGDEERTSVVIELGPSRRLVLLAAETRWGLLLLGFVTERLMGREALDAVRDAFRRTVNEKEHEPS